MEDTFLEELKRDIQSDDFGSGHDAPNIWYNEDGDCLQFKTTHVATIGKRIDEYLTLYLSAENNEPIGFQLKDIHALYSKHDADLMSVQADYTSEGKILISMSMLMLKAFKKKKESINRLTGYSEAFSITRGVDRVEIPVAV